MMRVVFLPTAALALVGQHKLPRAAPQRAVDVSSLDISSLDPTVIGGVVAAVGAAAVLAGKGGDGAAGGAPAAAKAKAAKVTNAVWSGDAFRAATWPAGPARSFSSSRPVWKSNFTARSLNQRVVLHAIDATPARWRGDAGSSPLDRARTAASSPRNDLVKNCRVHPTHWLIYTQVLTIRDLGGARRGLELVGDARIRYARHK